MFAYTTEMSYAVAHDLWDAGFKEPYEPEPQLAVTVDAFNSRGFRGRFNCVTLKQFNSGSSAASVTAQGSFSATGHVYTPTPAPSPTPTTSSPPTSAPATLTPAPPTPTPTPRPTTTTTG
jgi:hypothetical protein